MEKESKNKRRNRKRREVEEAKGAEAAKQEKQEEKEEKEEKEKKEEKQDEKVKEETKAEEDDGWTTVGQTPKGKGKGKGKDKGKEKEKENEGSGVGKTPDLSVLEVEEVEEEEEEVEAGEEEQKQGGGGSSSKRRRKKKKGGAKKKTPADLVITKEVMTKEKGLATQEICLEVMEIIDLFLNNEFSKAEKLVEGREKEPYFAMSLGTIWGIKGMMTFDKNDIAVALEKLNKAIHLCKKNRKDRGWIEGWLNASGVVAGMTSHQLHAELIVAEAGLFKALLTFLSGDGIGNFIRGGLDIHHSYGLYQTCWEMLLKNSKTHKGVDVHWLTGVQLGNGVFNLMISLLPPRMLNLAKFAGFSGDRELGLGLIEEASQLGGMRSSLASLMLLGYHAYLAPNFDFFDADLHKAQRIINIFIKKYPNSIIFNFFLGRVHFVGCKLKKATEVYQNALKIPHDEMWDRLFHIIWWEMVWTSAGKQDWESARDFAGMLKEKNPWSKCIWTYLHAAFTFVCSGATDEVTKEFEEVPDYKQRIAGKSVPMEKFCIQKAKKYELQKKSLFLPHLELLYFWQGLRFVENREGILEIVQKAIEEVKGRESYGKPQEEHHHRHPHLHKGKGKESQKNYDAEDMASGLLYQGVLLRQLKREKEALESFEEFTKIEKDIHHDMWLKPYAHFEMGKVLVQMGEKEKGRVQLRKAASHWTGYDNESRLHFLVQSQLAALNDQL